MATVTLIIGISGFLDDFSSRPPKNIAYHFTPTPFFADYFFVRNRFMNYVSRLINFWFVYANRSPF